jgi:hypothetical protein
VEGAEGAWLSHFCCCVYFYLPWPQVHVLCPCITRLLVDVPVRFCDALWEQELIWRGQKGVSVAAP